jgi:CRISPR/Cas system-associated protein Csm6
MKIITTVGISLITNYLEQHPKADFDTICDQPFDISLFDGKSTNQVKKLIANYENELFHFIKNSHASAEISSIEQIEGKDTSDIFLLCTETVGSYMCGRVLEKHFSRNRTVRLDYVKGLQLKNLEAFKQSGVSNLLVHIEKYAQSGTYWSDLVLNLTGGYKGLIPIMSIIGQVKQIPIYYLFKGDENEDYEIIEMPRMPIDYKLAVFEDYWQYFSLFGESSNEIISTDAFPYQFVNDCDGFLEQNDDVVALNWLGKTLWWNYCSQFFIFYTDKEVWQQIQEQHEIQRILRTKICNVEIRKSKTERKQGHYVFDDGNNRNRIYYFETEGKVYIYQSFQNEEKAKAYIDVPFTETLKTEFIKKSKPQRIQIQK